jgi:proteasome component ECM29
MRDADSSVSSLWRECWEDGGAAVDLTDCSNDDDGNTLDEKLLFGLTKECTAALGDVSWKLRVTGANALKDLVERGILAPPPRRLNGDSSFDSPRRAMKRAKASCLALTSLVKLIDRARIWTGKNEVVKAAVTLATAWVHSEQTSATILDGLSPILLRSPSSDKDLFLGDSRFGGSADAIKGQTEGSDLEGEDPMQTTDEEGSSVCIVGLSRLLLEQSFPEKGVLRSVAEEDVLPYRSNVLHSLELLLRSLPDSDWGIPVKQRIFPYIAPKLFGVFSDESTKEAPLIVTRTLSCFGANFYHKMSFSNDETNYLDVSSLSLLFLHHVDYSKQPAWTIREAAAKCCARMAQCADVDTYRSRYVSRLVDVGSIAVKDRKFWKVRLAGLAVLQAIVLRTDKRESTQEETLQEKQLILEAVLPYKETIQGIAKRMLNDTESAVTALSTKILSSLSTWP